MFGRAIDRGLVYLRWTLAHLRGRLQRIRTRADITQGKSFDVGDIVYVDENTPGTAASGKTLRVCSPSHRGWVALEDDAYGYSAPVYACTLVGCDGDEP